MVNVSGLNAIYLCIQKSHIRSWPTLEVREGAEGLCWPTSEACIQKQYTHAYTHMHTHKSTTRAYTLTQTDTIQHKST